MMFDGEDQYCYSPSEVFNLVESSMSKKKGMNKRRFNDEQVKLLESIFENETKLEPKKKVEVASQLGLHPRQVAIWFQNKRARYKSKLLERDYNLLRANYNSLVSQFDNLKKEQLAMITQVQKLKEEIAGKEGEAAENQVKDNNNNDEINKKGEMSEKRNKTRNEESEEAKSMQGSEYNGASILSDDGSTDNTSYYFGMLELEPEPEPEPKSGDVLCPDVLFDKADSSPYWCCDFWS